MVVSLPFHMIFTWIGCFCKFPVGRSWRGTTSPLFGVNPSLWVLHLIFFLCVDSLSGFLRFSTNLRRLFISQINCRFWFGMLFMWHVLHVFADLVFDCSISLMWIVSYVNLFVRVDFVFRFRGCSPNVHGLLLSQVSVYDCVCALYIYVFCICLCPIYFFRVWQCIHMCSVHVFDQYMCMLFMRRVLLLFVEVDFLIGSGDFSPRLIICQGQH